MLLSVCVYALLLAGLYQLEVAWKRFRCMDGKPRHVGLSVHWYMQYLPYFTENSAPPPGNKFWRELFSTACHKGQFLEMGVTRGQYW